MTQHTSSISLSQLRKKIDLLPKFEMLILDVREEFEFNSLHIEHTINIPMSDVLSKEDSFRLYDSIVILCAHGSRAKQIADRLSHLDCELMYVDGSITDWEQHDLPLIKGPES